MKPFRTLIAATAVLLITLTLDGCSIKDHIPATAACLFESRTNTTTGEFQKATYDSQRRLTKITDKSLGADGKTFHTYETTFAYGADGKIATSTTTEGGKELAKRVYLYTNGVFSGIDTYQDGAKTPSFGRRYTLNAVGNIVMTKGTKTTDDPDGDLFTIEWIYDAGQNLTKAIHTFDSVVEFLDVPSDYDTNPVSSFSSKDYALSPYDRAGLTANNPRREQFSILDDKTGKLVLENDYVYAYTYDAKGNVTTFTETDNVSGSKLIYTLTYFGCN